MKQIRQQVPFERGVQQQPVKGGVLAKGANQLPRHVLEQAAIVTALGQLVHLHKPAVAAQGGFLFVQNGVVKIFFAREMAEKDGFADARGGGDVLGLRAAEAVPGEALHGHPQQLPAAVLAGHAGRRERGLRRAWAGRRGQRAASISKYSLLSAETIRRPVRHAKVTSAM